MMHRVIGLEFGLNQADGVVASNKKKDGVVMTDDRGNEGRDRGWPGVVRWELGAASGHVSDMLWQCDALRAGRLYQRSVFGSREEAEAFVAKMREVEPDQLFNVEAIKASTVWN